MAHDISTKVKGKTMKYAIFAIALAVTCGAASAGTVIIGDDPGGRVKDRVVQVQRLTEADAHVEIRGDYCNSACTMLLAVPGVCASPDTVFGFHGPTSSLPGIPLPQKEFERWSNVMADHYPPHVAAWFLREARYELRGLLRVSATTLIKDHGLKECPE